MNKREQQRLERREQILNCSLDMFISRGYEATKIRDIANRLNISTGLFFNYFPSKEKVYEELVTYGTLGPKNVFNQISGGTSPIKMFEDMTKAIFEIIKADSFTSKMFLLMVQAMQSEATPDSVKQILQGFDMTTPAVALILQGQQMGEIRQGDPLALASAYWGAIQGIAENMALAPNVPLPEADWIVDILRAKQ